MIIDSHTHIWVQDENRYPWQPIGGYIPKGIASAEMLIEEMDAAAVDGAMLVQPTPYGWDNRYLLDCADRYPERFRCVCLIDPFHHDAPNILKSLVSSHKASGIRINWNIHPAMIWQQSKSHGDLWQTAANLDLPVCLQMVPDQLELLEAYAAQYDNPIIIDHLGRPPNDCSPNEREFEKLLGVSRFKQVFIKLSGLNYYSSERAPYKNVWSLVRAACESFGAQRCMWGSDYPFVNEHWSYTKLLEVVKRDWGLDEDALSWVLGRTAYQLWWQ